MYNLAKEWYNTAAVVALEDSPAIGPCDIAAAGIAIGATGLLACAGVKSLVNYISSSIAKSKARKENTFLVSHFTSVDCAEQILESGMIEPSKWETNVFVMLEPSIPKNAENAGAKFTEAKITFTVKPTEIIKDPGTEQAGAFMFAIEGPVNIEKRNPVMTILE